jgi:hypothetical protein
MVIEVLSLVTGKARTSRATLSPVFRIGTIETQKKFIMVNLSGNVPF